MPEGTAIQLRRDTRSNFSSEVLASGYPVWATDEKKLYIGDGSTAGGILQTGTGHGTGVVTAHSDVSSAGSGQIITGTERTNFGTAYSHSQITTGNPHNLDAADVGAATSGHTHGQLHDESHTITSHSDVTTATGANLDTLVGGGVTALHSHTAPTIAHSATTGQTINDHHNQDHALDSASDHNALSTWSKGYDYDAPIVQDANGMPSYYRGSYHNNRMRKFVKNGTFILARSASFQPVGASGVGFRIGVPIQTQGRCHFQGVFHFMITPSGTTPRFEFRWVYPSMTGGIDQGFMVKYPLYYQAFLTEGIGTDLMELYNGVVTSNTAWGSWYSTTTLSTEYWLYPNMTNNGRMHAIIPFIGYYDNYSNNGWLYPELRAYTTVSSSLYVCQGSYIEIPHGNTWTDYSYRP